MGSNADYYRDWNSGLFLSQSSGLSDILKLLTKGEFMSELGDKIAGKAKQAAGKITDDKKLQAEGKAQELKGKAESAVNDAKAKADKITTDLKDKKKND